MLYTIITLIGGGAFIGVYQLSLVLKSKATPKAVSFAQGAFVAVALLMLFAYSSRSGPGLTGTIILFCTAALSGLVLIYNDLTARPVPKWLAFIHGLAAVSGFVFLLAFTFTH